jgi:hypothetical protein
MARIALEYVCTPDGVQLSTLVRALFRLLFGRCMTEIAARRPATLTEIFRGLPRFPHENSVMTL